MRPGYKALAMGNSFLSGFILGLSPIATEPGLEIRDTEAHLSIFLVLVISVCLSIHHPSNCFSCSLGRFAVHCVSVLVLVCELCCWWGRGCT